MGRPAGSRRPAPVPGSVLVDVSRLTTSSMAWVAPVTAPGRPDPRRACGPHGTNSMPCGAFGLPSPGPHGGPLPPLSPCLVEVVRREVPATHSKEQT